MSKNTSTSLGQEVIGVEKVRHGSDMRGKAQAGVRVILALSPVAGDHWACPKGFGYPVHPLLPPLAFCLLISGGGPLWEERRHP